MSKNKARVNPASTNIYKMPKNPKKSSSFERLTPDLGLRLMIEQHRRYRNMLTIRDELYWANPTFDAESFEAAKARTETVSVPPVSGEAKSP